MQRLASSPLISFACMVSSEVLYGPPASLVSKFPAAYLKNNCVLQEVSALHCHAACSSHRAYQEG